MMEKCSIGLECNVDCHKQGLTRRQGLLDISAFSSGEKQELLWRAGLFDCGKLFTTVCYYHREYFGVAFERKFQKCCNLYKKHGNRKKNVKGNFYTILMKQFIILIEIVIK